jgi:DNA-binding LacI/PurR family transcriptional regulator
VPEHAGVYGLGNTPWAVQEGLTSIAFDPDLWAREIFAAIDELEEEGVSPDRRIPPSLVERASTLPLGTAQRWTAAS